MKSIKLKAIEENLGNGKIIVTTYDLLRSAVNNNPEQGGFSVDEMVKRLRILEKIDEHKETFSYTGDMPDGFLNRESSLDLEDSDFEKLKELFLRMRWGILSKSIVELSKEINNA